MKPRILVIDDEGAIRDSLRMILEYEDYQFVGAATGQEGIAAVQRERPDLVLVPGTTAEMVQRVLDHQVEGAFVCGPVSHPDLIEEVMFREELVVVTARRVQTLQDALGRRDLKIVVLRLGCSYR